MVERRRRAPAIAGADRLRIPPGAQLRLPRDQRAIADSPGLGPLRDGPESLRDGELRAEPQPDSNRRGLVLRDRVDHRGAHRRRGTGAWLPGTGRPYREPGPPGRMAL